MEGLTPASQADFIHKYRIVLKELNETRVWLRIIERSHMLESGSLKGITEENLESARSSQRRSRQLGLRAYDVVS